MTDEEIFSLFHYRCIMCKRPATEINHIVPKSRGAESDDWTNMAPSCKTCHDEFHQNGVTPEKIWKWQFKRKEFLSSMGKKELI